MGKDVGRVVGGNVVEKSLSTTLEEDSLGFNL